ncbi:MAG: hypothetical protein K9J06_06720 [Flavobacteriales bacterium]|nr:hypothetical protein [Flavobacteriales bacterium]
MKKICLVTLLFIGCTPFTSTSGGPMPVHRSDSLAVVRLVRPLSSSFTSGTTVYMGKGLGRVASMENSGTLATDVRSAAETTLENFLKLGYKVENTTEQVNEGLQINTFYLKKRTT